MEQAMRSGLMPRLRGAARTGLAIAPLVPVVLASLYFSGQLPWSPGYPVRIAWDEIPVIVADAPQGSGLASGNMGLTLPMLAEEAAQEASLALGEETDPATEADLAGPAGERDGQVVFGTPAGRAVPGVMPLSFSLAANPDAGGILQVRKAVSFNQQSLGNLSVRIDEAARVYVSVPEMGRMFPESLRPPRSWQDEFVLLSRVREAGIDLRYDPTADRFILRDDTAD